MNETECGAQIKLKSPKLNIMMNRFKSFRNRCRAGVVLLIFWLGTPALAGISINGRVTYTEGDEFRINVGTNQGLRTGLQGTLRLQDGQRLDVEVLNVGPDSALCRLLTPSSQLNLLFQNVELSFESVRRPVQDSNQTSESQDFVPLLAPMHPKAAAGRAANVSHGRIQFRQMIQTDSQTHLDYSLTHVSSSGSLERMDGSPWSLQWAGHLLYRDGDGYRSQRNYQDPQLILYRVSLQRPWADGGFLRVGSFLPPELPGIGTIDGVQQESHPGEHVRFGAVAGFKPRRIDLAGSGNEPTVVGYTTWQAGKMGRHYVSGTAGLLGSWFKGQANRLALLWDQRADFNPRLSLYSTASVDFDVGAAHVHNGTRLTRLDVYGVSRVTATVRVRAGVDHWERPDNAAERDLLTINDSRYFDNGYWRYWIGSDQRLSHHLRLSQEISTIAPDSGDLLWRLGLTRTGFWSMSDASMALTVYNLSGATIKGYGGRLSGYLPLGGRRLTLQPSTGFRWLDTESGSNSFKVSYCSLRLDSRVSSHWRLFGGGTYTFGDQVDARLLEFGMRYIW